MDAIIRAVVVYAFLLLMFRLAGKRTLSESTPFDLILLLIISETTQNALTANNHSMTHSGLLVLSLITADVLLSLAKQKFASFESALDGTAVILVRDGKLLWNRLQRERVDTADILEALRSQHGLERLSQIKLAVLERGGSISIIPQ